MPDSLEPLDHWRFDALHFAATTPEPRDVFTAGQVFAEVIRLTTRWDMSRDLWYCPQECTCGHEWPCDERCQAHPGDRYRDAEPIYLALHVVEEAMIKVGLSALNLSFAGPEVECL